MNPESTAEHEKPSTRPGLHVAGDHRAPHAAVSHVVRRRPDPDGSGTALRAAVLATMVRYCRGGRVDVADHREVRSYDVDLDSPSVSCWNWPPPTVSPAPGRGGVRRAAARRQGSGGGRHALRAVGR